MSEARYQQRAVSGRGCQCRQVSGWSAQLVDLQSPSVRLRGDWSGRLGLRSDFGSVSGLGCMQVRRGAGRERGRCAHQVAPLDGMLRQYFNEQ